MLAIPRDWTFKNYLIPPDSKCYKNMRIIITRSYLFWPLNHNFSKSLKLNCQCSYKYVQSFWNWPSVFWIYREYLCEVECWKEEIFYYKIFQFAVLPEYFEEICEVLKAHFAAVCDGAGAEAAETEVLLQYGLAEIAL